MNWRAERQSTTRRLGQAAIAAVLMLAWSVAGQDYRIAFQARGKNDTAAGPPHHCCGTGLYVMDADGSHRRQVTDDNAAVLLDGAWSPDGTQLAFVALREGGMRLGARGVAWNGNGDEDLLKKYNLPFHFAVYVMKSDGTEQRRLLDVPAVPGVRWSPDGKRLVLSSAYENTKGSAAARGPRGVAGSAVYVADVVTGGIKRITSLGETPMSPSAVWSPGGAQVAYICRDENGPAGICAVNADGSGRRHLTEGYANTAFPAWSPDGRRLAFTGAPDTAPGDAGVYVVAANGGNAVRVSRLRATRVVWSPEGRHLLLHGPAGTYLVDLEANSGIKLPIPPRALDHAFTPDGKTILYRLADGIGVGIYVVGTAGGPAHPLDTGDLRVGGFAVSGRQVGRSHESSSGDDTSGNDNLAVADRSALRFAPKARSAVRTPCGRSLRTWLHDDGPAIHAALPTSQSGGMAAALQIALSARIGPLTPGSEGGLSTTLFTRLRDVSTPSDLRRRFRE
jgi:Tol biopolymer transport system component